MFGLESIEFEKYVSPIINLANRFAGGTKPKVVGQMSDLIHEFEGNTLEDWEKWYSEKNPEGINRATEKIMEMIEKLKETLSKIDEDIVREWVRDLVIVKTFVGLKFQEAILKKCADLLEVDYRLAGADDESRGIDGYIGDIPVSIKPESYKLERGRLSEKIDVPVLYYRKEKDYVEVELTELQKRLVK